jgi:hypothetical protein
MILSITGFGHTGHSALIDLFKEVNEIFIIKEEITIINCLHGLLDLDYSIAQYPNRSQYYFINNFKKLHKSNSSIHSVMFKAYGENYLSITNQFIENLVYMSKKEFIEEISSFNRFKTMIYNGIKNSIKVLFGKKLYKKVSKIYRAYDNQNLNLTRWFLQVKKEVPHTKNPELFVSNVRKYLYDLHSPFINDDRLTIVNHLISPFNTIRQQQLIDAKVIILDRDPRDVYLEQYAIEKNKKDMNGRSSNLDYFIEMYMYERRISYKLNMTNQNALFIRFEDLVLNTSDVINDINSFLGTSYKFQFKHFNPSISIQNTKLFSKPEYSTFSEDIYKIKVALSEFLYPFD